MSAEKIQNTLLPLPGTRGARGVFLKQKTRYLRTDAKYHAVFNEQWNIRVFLVAVEILKSIDAALQKSRGGPTFMSKATLRRLRFHLAALFAILVTGKHDYTADELSKVTRTDPTPEEVEGLVKYCHQKAESPDRPRKLFRSKDYAQKMIQEFTLI